jgi:hypothetical protein
MRPRRIGGYTVAQESPGSKLPKTRRLHAEFIATSSSLHPAATFSRPTDPTMKSSSALFLQVAVVLIGIATLALMLWEPHLEGRNVHATTFEIYFKDPFLAYVYVGSTPFFIALYRAFRLFGNVRQNGAFSQVTVDALRTIKRCAIAIICFVAGAIAFIIRFGDDDDRPAGVFMSFLVIFASIVIATAAAISARKLQNTLGRSEASPG